MLRPGQPDHGALPEAGHVGRTAHLGDWLGFPQGFCRKSCRTRGAEQRRDKGMAFPSMYAMVEHTKPQSEKAQSSAEKRKRQEGFSQDAAQLLASVANGDFDQWRRLLFRMAHWLPRLVCARTLGVPSGHRSSWQTSIRVPCGWLCLWHAVKDYGTSSSQAVDCLDFRQGNVFQAWAAVSKESPPHCRTRPGHSHICFLPTQDGSKGGRNLG